MKSLCDTLSDLTSAIQAVYKVAEENFEAVGNMCGLALLPTELLARIFECVVNGDESLSNPSRWKAAFTLSHLCQYFRIIALCCPQMWSNISKNNEMVASCLSRSKDVPLDVELTIDFGSGADPRDLLFEQLLSEVLLHSKRWRRLHIQFVSNSEDGDAACRTSVDGLDVREAFRSPDVPLLESLDIRNDMSANSLYMSYNEFAHWNAPSLRRVTAVHYFPLSLPSLTNVTTLDITLILNQIDFSDMLADLSRMRFLEDFTLKLDSCSDGLVEPSESQQYERTELPSIRHLRIETERESVHDSDSSLVKCSLFSSLFFPGAVDLHVKLSGEVTKFYLEADYATLDLEEEIMQIFQNAEQFPCVRSFCLESCGIYDGPPNTSYWIDSQQGYIEIFIPFNMLPNAKHFKLQSNRWTKVMEEREIEGRVPGDTLPTLETITIETPPDSPLSFVKSRIGDFLRKQKDRGEWGEFRELVVVNGNVADDIRKKKVSETYVGDTVLEWCEG